MRVLIYKRTHPFDPNTDGVFGCEDCMGAVRRRQFDAVIGVGGISAEPRGWGIDGRLNWVGVGAHATETIAVGDRGPLVTFDRFILLEEGGPKLKDIAPALARLVYSVHRRVVMSDGLSPSIQREIRKILSLASRARRNRISTRYRTPKARCIPRRCSPPKGRKTRVPSDNEMGGSRRRERVC
jgi:hypothetical protein